MQTILDTGHSWFLEKLVYEDKLQVYVLEALLSDKPEELTINGHTIENTYCLITTETSRQFVISFDEILAYNVVEESYTFANDYEIRTKGILCKYERSFYLDFIVSSTLVESLKTKQYAHYGVILENFTIDVISTTAPNILQL
jgi:hypothetical protein